VEWAEAGGPPEAVAEAIALLIEETITLRTALRF
jgi:hypothetical protein